MIERLLIAGLGSIGSRHARVARSLMPDARIAALRRTPHTAAAPIDEIFTSLEEALAWRPQAAVISGPATARLAVAMPLARASTHLLVEKPVADRTENAAALIAACEDSHAVLALGYNLRHSASLREFRARVHAGEAGTILSVRAEVGQHLSTWRPSVDYRASVSAQEALGGGVLRELSHEIDYLRWIFGEFTWVTAAIERASALEIDVEDAAYLTCGLRSPRGHAVTAALTMDFFRHDQTRVCVAIGDRASLRWNGVARTVERLDAGSTAWSVVFADESGPDASYIAQWRDFLGAIASGRKPEAGGQDGLAVLRLIEAARQAADTGRRVAL